MLMDTLAESMLMYNPDCFTRPATYLKAFRDCYNMVQKTQVTLGIQCLPPCLYDVYVP